MISAPGLDLEGAVWRPGRFVWFWRVTANEGVTWSGMALSEHKATQTMQSWATACLRVWSRAQG